MLVCISRTPISCEVFEDFIENMFKAHYWAKWTSSGTSPWVVLAGFDCPPSLRSAASHYYIIYVRCSCVSEAHGRFWIATGNKTHSYKGRSLHGNFPHVSPGHIFSSGTSHKLHISRFCSRDLLVHRWTVLQWRKPPCSVPHRLKGTQIYLCTATVCLCKARLVENWASQWRQE